MHKIEIYRLNLTDSTIDFVDEIETFEKLSYSDRLNNIAGASFEMSAKDEKATIVNLARFRNVVVIKRNNTVVWAGPIINVTGQAQDVGLKLTIQCANWLWFLKNRYTDQEVTYSSIDQDNIAWDLIDDSQSKTNGELFITQGAVTTSISRDRTYEYKRIADALTDLTNVINGFDFDFSYTVDADGRLTGVKFNSYYPEKGINRTELEPLEIGVNVLRYSFINEGIIENAGTAIGAGTGNDILISTEDKTASQIAYTRIEVIKSRKDVSIQDTLDDYIEDYINNSSVERYKVGLTIEPSSNITLGRFNSGDRLKVSGTFGNYKTLDRFYRCIGWDVNIDENGAEILTPILEII